MLVENEERIRDHRLSNLKKSNASEQEKLIAANDIETEFYKSRDFVVNLAESLVVYDPLNRRIPCDDAIEDMAIKRDELLKRLLEMPTADSQHLNATLTSSQHEQLVTFFEKEFLKCKLLIEKELEHVKFSKQNIDLSTIESLKLFKASLEFFTENKLFEPA